MKKFLALALVILLTVSLFAACAKDEPVDNNNDTNTSTDTNTDTNTTTSELKDGKYLIKEAVSDHGNYPMATMEVKNGEIVSFNYQEYLTSGEPKNSSNYNYPATLEVIQALNKEFLEKKDADKLNYDVVTGATHTKDSFKKISKELVEKAKKGEVYTPVYKDGVYEVKAAKDSYGWLAEIKVVVLEGTILMVI